MTTYAVVGQSVTREDGPREGLGTDVLLRRLDSARDALGEGAAQPVSPRPHRPYRHLRRVAVARRSCRAPSRDLTGMLVGRTLRDTPLLAQEKVRFVGEKVAAVAADDVDTAEEALTLIEVEYEELPAIFDPVQAMQPGAGRPRRRPDLRGPSRTVQPRGNISHHHTWSGGDVEQGFRESDLLFEHTFTTPGCTRAIWSPTRASWPSMRRAHPGVGEQQAAVSPAVATGQCAASA